jgi:hypothetical protein
LERRRAKAREQLDAKLAALAAQVRPILFGARCEAPVLKVSLSALAQDEKWEDEESGTAPSPS